ncbi:DNA polymerase III subunit gamma/tau [Turneriella parva]|uniref:DNA polymerase III subunit gamma/tau n=1 Tax=Turneriella parva (strain ATCC BAA-1111 / DSM 21527 / NCTC 11395 / H) TaxID=869212 RepID=I4B8F1_TURPD|nr:DNA polymerase III subunit gamma/tau [Turneriella parva]AFM13558.1 DNA polymerase III, tau subunit [Turneriella parva DSM 21527]
MSLATKYRPRDFEDLVGQLAASQSLKNALEFRKIGHAYLFHGARGVGKTTMARILAKALNCVNGPTSQICNVCEHCVEISEGRATDVIEIDAASNRGIDNIRELRAQAVFAPMKSRYKVYILDEVHMLSPESFNALLKTLEEPPHHVVFIMATTELHKIPETIASRCQVFTFKKFNAREIAQRLAHILEKEQIAFERDALLPIAERGEGSLRDAISLLDQTLAFSGSDALTLAAVRESLDILPVEVYSRFVQGLRTGDLHALLNAVHELTQGGANLRIFLKDLLAYLRTVVLVSEKVEVHSLAKDEAELVAEAARAWDRQALIRVFQQLFKLNQDFSLMLSAKSSELKMSLEIALVDLVHKLKEPSVSALVGKIERLKQAIETGKAFDDTAVAPKTATAAPRESAVQPQTAAPAEPPARTAPKDAGPPPDTSTLLQKAFLAEEVAVTPESEKLFGQA